MLTWVAMDSVEGTSLPPCQLRSWAGRPRGLSGGIDEEKGEMLDRCSGDGLAGLETGERTETHTSKMIRQEQQHVDGLPITREIVYLYGSRNL